MMVVAALAVILLLHGPGGREIRVNTAHVTSMHAAIEGEPNKAFTDEVRCVINLADGKFVSVIEPCHVVQSMLEGEK
jgi:hypothetical protein